MDKLLSLVNELEQKASHCDKVHDTVSLASVGWHVQHSLLVISQIITRMKGSDPAVYKWKFNLARSYVYLWGRIPRGRGKAPELVVPKGPINSEEISRHLLLARNAIGELPALHTNNFIKHPYFGELNLKQVQTFLIIHTQHHLKIIEDVLRNSKSY